MSRDKQSLNGRKVYPVEVTQTKIMQCYVAANSPEEAEEIARKMNDSEGWYEVDAEPVEVASNRLPWSDEAFDIWRKAEDEYSGILHVEPGTDWPIWDEGHEWEETP